MAVAIQLDFPGATLDQYDEVIKKMGLTPGQGTPPGALFHWVTKTDEGICVVDVWESREVFDKFSEERIGPITQEVGMSPPSRVEYHDVHNYLIRS
jgi:hypothetical protein